MILKPTTPKVFAPLWTQSARFKGAKGGRGSGKSWDRGLAVILSMVARPGFRVVALREVQGSIKESVHELLDRTIQREGLGAQFEVLENEIRGPGGSQVIFKGMKDQNAETVKSLEGADIAWYEEAQTATQRSLDLLRPTIRKPGSELWFTWNPRFRTDPIDAFFAANVGDPDFVLVEANWWDNPWFPDVLQKERLIDQRGDPDRYAHIWEGAYESESDAQFIGGRVVWKAQRAPVIFHPSDPIILGLDVARHGDDDSVLWMRRGLDARTIPPVVFNDKPDLMQLAGRVADVYRQSEADAIFVDEGGMGYGVLDRLRQLGIPAMGVNFGGAADRSIAGLPKCYNKRAQMWATMRQWMLEGGAVPVDVALERDLTGPTFQHDAKDAIQLEKKRDMKKRGVPSPDRADALALTFAYPVQGRSIREQLQDQQDEDWNPIWS